MRVWILAVAATVVVLGCAEASDRVTRVKSPSGGTWFVTHCRHSAQCYADAKEICPGGWSRNPDEGTPQELYFQCHGKANW